MDNAHAFEQYLSSKRSELGFFGADYWMDFQLFSDAYSRLTVYARERFEQYCETLFNELDKAGAVWGAAGIDLELESRNYLKIEQQYAPSHYCAGWVGEDHHKYIPGLFWINYWSREYTGTRDVNPHSIVSRLGGKVTSLQNGVIFRLYDRAVDWIDKQRDVDDFLESSEAFFSMRRVGIPQIRTPKDTMKFIETCQKWP
jgi:hypothetical protein